MLVFAQVLLGQGKMKLATFVKNYDQNKESEEMTSLIEILESDREINNLFYFIKINLETQTALFFIF